MKNTINKIIFFAAVFAAGLFNISANAQQTGVMTEAQAAVFSPLTGTFPIPALASPGNTQQVNFPLDGLAINTILFDVGTQLGNVSYIFWYLLDDSDGETRATGGDQDTNNYPVFGDAVIAGGQRLVFNNGFYSTTPNYDSTYEMTVRVYTDGTDYFMATGEVSAGESYTLAADLQTGEFFLDATTWMTAAFSPSAFGFEAVVCLPTYDRQPDMISCACPADEIDTGNSCRLPTNDSGNGDAECASLYGNAQPVFDESETDNCRPTARTDCDGTQTFDDTEKTCKPRTFADCGNNEVFEPASEGGGGVCISATEVLATVAFDSPAYTTESCENAQWQTEFVFSNDKQEVAEVCGIPVVRNDSATAAIASAAESVPLQFPENVNANGCIIRMSPDFVAENMPNCDDPELFGRDGRFPQMPENFNLANDRLIVAVVADGRNRVFFNGNEIRTITSPQNNETEVAIFGAVGIAMAAFAIVDFFHNGRPADAFAFSPEFNYSISENDYFVQAGGKIEYAVNENLRMQWSAGQTNTGGDFGDFRYLSKAEYKTDLFAAAFSESVAGETANYNFALSANLQNGIWKISPVYRMQSEWKESDSGIKTETQNELNLESVLRYNRWTIRPSAGFRWENANNFAENGKLQMNAVYRF